MSDIAEVVAKRIAMALYGGYPVGRDARESWQPQWRTATIAAEAALAALDVVDNSSLPPTHALFVRQKQ